MTDRREDAELEAIQQVLAALQSLESDARGRVVQYVFQRLGIVTPGPSDASSAKATPPSPHTIASAEGAPRSVAGVPVDIRSLADEKQPRSANEMAALVAYYLAELAPSDERKDEITVDDLKKYFKQARYPLPKAPGQTLINARNAGYLDPGSGRGLFRLNPVGHNLVVHTLPASEGRRSGAAGRTSKRGTSRKAKSGRSPNRKKRSPKR